MADVETSWHAARSGSPYVVLHHRTRHTYVRLDAREAELLSLMDGTTTVRALVVAYFQRHRVLALPRIARLLDLLAQNGFLEGARVDVYRRLRQQLRQGSPRAFALRILRGFLRAELTIGRTDALLDRWYAGWGWAFFTWPAIALGMAIALAGPFALLVAMIRTRYELFRFEGSYGLGTGLVIALGLLAVAVHELGHGLAVKHVGRSVHRAGVMLYYGLPAAFVDTSDVWMASRRQRLLTALAGPWTGLLVGGACGLAALLVPEGPLGAVLFSWAFVFLVENLLNFNPLLELDGYYMLVDLLEKPLLRARALRFVRGPLWQRLWRRDALSGEEKLFAAFGLGSAIYTVFTLGLAVFSWQRRIAPEIVEAWVSGQVLPRAVVLLAAAAVLMVLVLALWAAIRESAAWLSRQFVRLGLRAAQRRYSDALSALREVPAFAALPGGWLLEMARATHSEQVASGVEVVRQGDPGDRFYVVAGGTFDVLVDGVRTTRLGRGDYFGERALLSGAPRAATVVATTSGQLYSLGKGTFRALVANDLAVAARLTSALEYRGDIAANPVFGGLSATEVDLLLTRLVPVAVETGETVIRQGEPGDRFYVVRSGSLEVLRDGARIAVLGAGDAFGEIALLHRIPRTATVRALGASSLLALEAEDFRELLAGYCGRATELGALSDTRMPEHQPAGALGEV